jgi:hypothetical protein
MESLPADLLQKELKCLGIGWWKDTNLTLMVYQEPVFAIKPLICIWLKSR